MENTALVLRNSKDAIYESSGIGSIDMVNRRLLIWGNSHRILTNQTCYFRHL